MKYLYFLTYPQYFITFTFTDTFYFSIQQMAKLFRHRLLPREREAVDLIYI